MDIFPLLVGSAVPHVTSNNVISIKSFPNGTDPSDAEPVCENRATCAALHVPVLAPTDGPLLRTIEQMHDFVLPSRGVQRE